VKELKFRAWNPYENIMMDSYFIMNSFGNVLETSYGEISATLTECKVMQFTGFYDKNGKEIYIGDVVEIEVETTEGFYRTDRYEVIINDFMKIPVIDNELGQDKLFNCYHFCKVIGNRYENPELLEDKN
jgi:uncharacterized phage protein (TIGR01671 family)